MNHNTGAARFGRGKRGFTWVGALIGLTACGGPDVGAVGAVGTAASFATGTASAVGGAVGTVGTVGGAVLGAAATAAAQSDRQGGENAAQEIAEQSQGFGGDISQQIAKGVTFCAAIPTPEYRIDCFADQLAQIVGDIPDDPDLADARGILSDASVRLTAVATAQASRSLQPALLNPGPSGERQSSRVITAVETDALPQALAEAELILKETETRLLRSAENSQRRKVAYQEMAQAFGGRPILLRTG